ncbi:MAG: NAD(P)H-dependent glycerol-3-phosphate dehydrogenase [Desulfatiglandaceae bacterium]|jgi:glycerol-3-phosphate dehydrogenase (NAD(P)+)
MDEISKIGVIGAGSWGTALANLLASKGKSVDLWVREKEVYDQIRLGHENGSFLPGCVLPDNLRPVRSFEEALYEKELALVVVPSHVFREVLGSMRPYLQGDVPLIAGTKGIENATGMMMSQVAASILPEAFMKTYACLSGPSFAKEVSSGYPTAVTIACYDMTQAERMQRLFSTPFFRVYITEDLIGTQLGGALKNVIAIAAGVSDGLGFGHNPRAALITRGLAEITRLGVAMGANPHTFAGLAGMGDLVLTCTGDMSRNRTVGLKLGKGLSLDEITDGMKMVAEGIKTARSAYELSRKIGVELPIITQVYEVLYRKKDPREAVKALMARELKVELEH